jgi:hypothetical protein
LPARCFRHHRKLPHCIDVNPMFELGQNPQS